MDDLQWLATRTGVSLLGGQPPFDVSPERFGAGVVVEPTHVAAATRLGVPVIAVVGWPTGRHHSVIKAAEARLAAESGAAEVWLAVDPGLDENAALADVIAVHQAISPETRFGVIHSGGAALAAAAERSGAEVLAVPSGVDLTGTRAEVAAYGVEGGEDAVVAALEAGASRVFLTPPAPRPAARP